MIEDRSVGFIELFYDLVYGVVIARAAHHLAEHLSWRGVGEFAVVFGMIWLAWLNGTLYQDFHGREDGRSRTYVFLQMGILAVLAVPTAEADGESGQGFAIGVIWILSHLPVSMAFAAAARRTRESRQNAGNDVAPLGAAWVLAGSITVALAALIVTRWSLADYERLQSVYRTLTTAMVGAVAAAAARGLVAAGAKALRASAVRCPVHGVVACRGSLAATIEPR